MTEIQNLTRKARTAESFAESCRVQIARLEWNENHPDSKPMDLKRWGKRADRLGNILRGLLGDEPAHDTAVDAIQ